MKKRSPIFKVRKQALAVSTDRYRLAIQYLAARPKATGLEAIAFIYRVTRTEVRENVARMRAETKNLRRSK